MAAGTKHGIDRHGGFRRLAPWSIAALILLLPLIVMRFTDEVNWDAADFAVMGALLLGACGVYEGAARMNGNLAYRAAIGISLVAAFLLVWINLAVGIIGSEGNPENLIFGGVLAIAILGALLARFRPCGMTRALIATALAQILACAVALIAGWGFAGESGPWPLVALTGFFSALWLGSATLFRRAGRG